MIVFIQFIDAGDLSREIVAPLSKVLWSFKAVTEDEIRFFGSLLPKATE